MIANFKPKKEYSTAELFFIEKFLELVHRKTLDSHRARLNNPKIILRELKKVLYDWKAKRVKNFNVVVGQLKEEALQLLELEHALSFKKIHISVFRKLLDIKETDDVSPLSYAIQLVINENKNYATELFCKIEEEINNLNSTEVIHVENYQKLNTLLGFLSSELLDMGYAKPYIFKILLNLYTEESQYNFTEAFEWLKSLCTRIPEDYKVVFKMTIKYKNGTPKSNFLLKESDIQELQNLNEECKTFFDKKERLAVHYFAIKEQGLDYFSVLNKAYRTVSKILDSLHLGFQESNIFLYSSALVIGTLKPKYSRIRSIDFGIDGNFKGNQKQYDQFYEKVTSVFSSEIITQETKNKLFASIHNLRLGWEAKEVEQKFLNYWIGIEYLFSNYEIDKSTIERLKDFFIKTHSTIYFKRNFLEFHYDIKRVKLSRVILDYDDSLEYLKKTDTYNFIIDNYKETNPLLAFRANIYKKLVEELSERNKILKHHSNNLNQHLTRIYRVRNELVHEGGKVDDYNIETITGNLRYYLTFILSSLLDFLENSEDVNMDGEISIDDFFHYNEIQYQSIGKEKTIDSLLSAKCVTELFS
jgi:hypothetical protein